jgi:hypothetical protein
MSVRQGGKGQGQCRADLIGPLLASVVLHVGRGSEDGHDEHVTVDNRRNGANRG